MHYRIFSVQYVIIPFSSSYHIRSTSFDPPLIAHHFYLFLYVSPMSLPFIPSHLSVQSSSLDCCCTVSFFLQLLVCTNNYTQYTNNNNNTMIDTANINTNKIMNNDGQPQNICNRIFTSRQKLKKKQHSSPQSLPVGRGVVFSLWGRAHSPFPPRLFQFLFDLYMRFCLPRLAWSIRSSLTSSLNNKSLSLPFFSVIVSTVPGWILAHPPLCFSASMHSYTHSAQRLGLSFSIRRLFYCSCSFPVLFSIFLFSSCTYSL